MHKYSCDVAIISLNLCEGWGDGVRGLEGVEYIEPLPRDRVFYFILTYYYTIYSLIIILSILYYKP